MALYSRSTRTVYRQSLRKSRFVPTLPSGVVNLLAEDVQSLSELSSPELGQTHVLLADDLQSLSEVSSPEIGQIHSLLANDLQSLTEVNTPALAEGSHVLLAEDLESLSEVSAPNVGQVHVLLSVSIESNSEVSTPVFGPIYGFTATSVESQSEISTPALLELSGAVLLAEDVESISEVSSPELAQIHVLLAEDLECSSEVSIGSPQVANYVFGTAVTSGGAIIASLVSEGFSGSAGDVYIFGTRHTNLGHMYVTVNAPTEPTVYLNGILHHRDSGVRYIQSGDIVNRWPEGFTTDVAGRQAYMLDYASVSSYSRGLSINSDGAMFINT